LIDSVVAIAIVIIQRKVKAISIAIIWHIHAGMITIQIVAWIYVSRENRVRVAVDAAAAVGTVKLICCLL